ncbi:hypothetical protein OHA98_28355 [Streptomyces sp. NBC_00654]|uniref:hypothetical protein n=1 Tax=Streptomyces sp. NBC_00654 TaxID=2975799 RepID=UPI00225265DF|nr:hypothetical protein [Streptomyces sp. NBC_00654]MCX4968599.1 hypothetical protein [Streptomyces sp. NBC_00654]
MIPQKQLVKILRERTRMEYLPVGREYWNDDDRSAAEDVATDFVNALRRVGINFDGIGIDPPCDTCQQDEHRIAVGWITLEEAARMTVTVNAALDELDRFHRTGMASVYP